MPAFDGKENCPLCHGSGTLYDWVPYGSGDVQMPTGCDCVAEQMDAWRNRQDALHADHDALEAQTDDLDTSKTAPPVRYIEYRLLELCEDLDARLTALEANPQEPELVSQLRSLVDENHHLEMDAYHAKADLAEAEAEVEIKTAELAAARAERDNFAEEAEALTRQRDNLGNALDKAAADVKERMYERDTLGAFVDALKAERNALAAQLDDLRNVNAGLRQDNASQSELIAALRQNSADLVEAMKDLQSQLAAASRERNAIAAQVDALGKNNAMLRAVYETDNARLRAALEEVEWCDGACPWCHGRPRGLGHSVACHRQAALR